MNHGQWITRAEDERVAAGEAILAAIESGDFDTAARGAAAQNYALVELMSDPHHRAWLLQAGPVAVHYSRQVIARGGEGNESPEALTLWSASVDQLESAVIEAREAK